MYHKIMLSCSRLMFGICSLVVGIWLFWFHALPFIQLHNRTSALPPSGLSHSSTNALHNTPPERRDRYLIFECVEGQGLCGGWADRQEGLVTTFLLANLTHRRFGIRITTPCDLTLFFLPAHYDWVVRDSEILSRSTRHISAVGNHNVWKKLSSTDFNAEHPQDVVFLRLNMDLLEEVAANPHYRHVLPSWARQHRPAAFRDGWRLLMSPTPYMKRQVDSFISSLPYVNRTRPLVGVHVRTGRSANFSDSRNDGDYVSSRLDVLWNFVQPYVDNGSDVFLATDNPDVRRSSEVRFGGRHHDTQVTLRHIDRQRADPDVCQAFGGAILDQLILASCDVLVMSPRSGFSRLAAMLRQSEQQLFMFDNDRVSPLKMF